MSYFLTLSLSLLLQATKQTGGSHATGTNLKHIGSFIKAYPHQKKVLIAAIIECFVFQLLDQLGY